MKQRNLFLDHLRGTAILIVVLGHAIQVCFGSADNALHSVIQTFQMSLLFIISGFSTGFSEPIKSEKQFLWSKVKRILLPYVIWSQLNYLLVAIINRNYSFLSQVKNLATSQFWFLRILFLMMLIYWLFVLLYRLLKKIPYRICRMMIAFVICGASAVVMSRLPGCGALLNYIPFFLLGNLLYKISKKYASKGYDRTAWIVTGVLTVVFAISVVLFIKTEGIFQWMIDKTMALSGSATCYFVCRLLYERPWLKKLTQVIASIGKNTLPVYAIHWCIFFSIPLPLYATLAQTVGIYPASFFIATVWTLLCVCLIWLLKKAKVTRLLLLGEK